MKYAAPGNCPFCDIKITTHLFDLSKEKVADFIRQELAQARQEAVEAFRKSVLEEIETLRKDAPSHVEPQEYELALDDLKERIEKLK